MSQPEMQPEGPARDERGEAPRRRPDREAVPARRLGRARRAPRRAVPVGRGGRAAYGRVVSGGPGVEAARRRGCCGSARRSGRSPGAALPLLELTGVGTGAAGWGYLVAAAGRGLPGVRPVLRADVGLDKGRRHGAGGAAAAAGAAVRLGVGVRTGGAGPGGGHGERGGGAVPGGAAAVLGGRDGAGAVGDRGLDGGVPLGRPAPLVMQCAGGGAGAGRRKGTGASGRLPLPPGTRPNMPRQRPPEAPR